MKNQQSNLIKNKEECFSALVGTMLGDSCVENKTKLISICHSIIHEDYALLKYNEFSRYYITGKLSYSNNWGSNPNEELRKARRFRISGKKNMDLVNKIEKIMYDENHKRRIPDIEYIEPISLFFWYLDDGAFIVRDNGKYIRRSLRICLKSYSDESILKLIDEIKEKYDIKFRADSYKDKIIRICLESEKEISKFLDTLYPFYEFVPQSLKYKFQPKFKKDNLKYLDIE